VISGPIFGDKPKVVKNGPDRKIQIPDAFYMILVDMDKEFRAKPNISLLAYKFPQNTKKDADYKDRSLFGTSVRAIEEATKLDFFPAFPTIYKDWDEREKEIETTHWPVS
jgi:DNA/RNA endonuclease G (NUC1)